MSPTESKRPGAVADEVEEMSSAKKSTMRASRAADVVDDDSTGPGATSWAWPSVARPALVDDEASTGARCFVSEASGAEVEEDETVEDGARSTTRDMPGDETGVADSTG